MKKYTELLQLVTFILMGTMLCASNSSNCFKIHSPNELINGVLLVGFRLESISVIIAFNS